MTRAEKGVLHHAICGLVQVNPKPGLSPSAKLLDIFGVSKLEIPAFRPCIQTTGPLFGGRGGRFGRGKGPSAMLGFQGGLWLPIGS